MSPQSLNDLKETVQDSNCNINDDDDGDHDDDGNDNDDDDADGDDDDDDDEDGDDRDLLGRIGCTCFRWPSQYFGGIAAQR